MMTQEEKAKAYDEALKRARNSYQNIKPENTAVKAMLEDAFPELRESEEERIRKELIRFLTEVKDISEAGRTVWAVRKEDVGMCTTFLGYLEKQKDKMTAEEYESSELFQLKLKTKYANGYQDALAQKEQKPVNNYLEWRNIVYYVLKEWLGIGQYMDMAPFNDIVKTLQEKYSLPKPAEWSEEEKDKLNSIERLIVNANAHGNYLIGDKEAIDLQHFIRSIVKPTTNLVEWSEEDERMWKSALWHIKNSCGNGGKNSGEFEVYQWFENRLKSFRPSWKPSEEQMKGLKFFLDYHRPQRNAGTTNWRQYDAVESLYNEIKNL